MASLSNDRDRVGQHVSLGVAVLLFAVTAVAAGWLAASGAHRAVASAPKALPRPKHVAYATFAMG